jgi:hypothetical protein
MPTGRTAPARYSRMRWSRHLCRRSAGRQDSWDHMSGLEPAPPSKPLRSSKSPKPECAIETPFRSRARITSGRRPWTPRRATRRPADIWMGETFADQDAANVPPADRQRSAQTAVLQLRVPSCPDLQAHATRIRRASPLPMRARKRDVAASARRRSSSQRALSPRSGVSKPTRRYTAPFKRTVSPSITSMIWPDGLTLLRCHIIHAAMAADASGLA